MVMWLLLNSRCKSESRSGGGLSAAFNPADHSRRPDHCRRSPKMTSSHGEKRYDARDTTLKFVNRPDDLDPCKCQLSRLGIFKVFFSSNAADVCDVMQYQTTETCAWGQRCRAATPSPLRVSLGGVAACWTRYLVHFHVMSSNTERGQILKISLQFGMLGALKEWVMDWKVSTVTVTQGGTNPVLKSQIQARFSILISGSVQV